MRRAVVPDAMRGNDAAFSPAIRSGDHLYLTGMTGRSPDGTMPHGAGSQMHAAIDKIASVLAAADATLITVVEMTSYHIALHETFDACEEAIR